MMLDLDRQKLILGAYALHLIIDANGGKEPETIWQYRRAARRFGVRIHILQDGVLSGSLLRQGAQTGEQGVIFASRTRNMARFRLEILHELGEAATRWEGVPPIVCQVSRHEVARRVEELCLRCA